MPPPVNKSQLAKERKALQEIVVHNFAANPGAVKTFGSTAVSWTMTLPDNDTIDIALHLNRKPVEATGTQQFSLQRTTSFELEAKTEHLGRKLETITVRVDPSECQSKPFGAFLITQNIKTAFDSRFSGSDEFGLRGNKTTVTLESGKIIIAVPVELKVQNWFNADMDIDIRLSLGIGSQQVKIFTGEVSVDVSWSLLEHLASFGCSGFIQSGMQKLAQAFMGNIVRSEVAPSLERAFNEELKEFTDSLTEADPRKRRYVLTKADLSADRLLLTACPR